MTMTRALLIIRNAECYPVKMVREAAIYVLGSLSAKSEDVLQASSLL